MPSHDNTQEPRIPRQRGTLHSPTDTDPAPDKPTTASPTARLRSLWHAAWAEGGPLHDMWEDLRQARTAGWHDIAPWIKTAALLAGCSLTVLLLDAGLAVLLDAVHRGLNAAPQVQVGTDTTTGVWAVIDTPVRHYIAGHADGLPVSASTVYTLWAAAGLAGLIGGTLRLTGARITWCAHGLATAAMVWEAAPANGCTLAAGITVLAWTLGSIFALRGMSLRPAFFTHVHNAPEIRPHIHLPETALGKDADSLSDTVRRLH